MGNGKTSGKGPARANLPQAEQPRGKGSPKPARSGATPASGRTSARGGESARVGSDVRPAFHIYLDYSFLDLETPSGQWGYVETCEFEDDDGVIARRLVIDANCGQRKIVWHCHHEFAIVPEVSEYFELPADGIPYLYRKDGAGYVWAAVRSLCDPDPDCYYKHSVTLFVAQPQPGNPAKRDLNYSIIPHLPCHPPQVARARSEVADKALVRATIVLQS